MYPGSCTVIVPLSPRCCAVIVLLLHCHYVLIAPATHGCRAVITTGRTPDGWITSGHSSNPNNIGTSRHFPEDIITAR